MRIKEKVTIELILHATEDVSKFLKIFKVEFGVDEEKFDIQNLKGHFDNPIIKIHAEISKKEALEFIKKLTSKMKSETINEIISKLENEVQNSQLYLRFDKQKFLDGILEISQKNAVKIKIFSPTYNKKDTCTIFSNLLKPY